MLSIKDIYLAKEKGTNKTKKKGERNANKMFFF